VFSRVPDWTNYDKKRVLFQVKKNHGLPVGSDTSKLIPPWIMESPSHRQVSLAGSEITGDIFELAERLRSLQIQRFQELQGPGDIEMLGSNFLPLNECKYLSFLAYSHVGARSEASRHYR